MVLALPPPPLLLLVVVPLLSYVWQPTRKTLWRVQGVFGMVEAIRKYAWRMVVVWVDNPVVTCGWGKRTAYSPLLLLGCVEGVR